MKPFFNRALLSRIQLKPAAATEFRKTSKKHTHYDAETQVTITIYRHPGGAVLIDSVRQVPRCFVCRTHPRQGGRRQGSELCQDCYDHSNP